MCTSYLCELVDDVCNQGSTANNHFVSTRVMLCAEMGMVWATTAQARPTIGLACMTCGSTQHDT